MASEREYLDSQIQNAEDNIRLIEVRKSEYPEPETIPLSLVKNEKCHRERLQELYRRRDELERAANKEEATASLPAETKLKRIWVNRDEEKKLFRDMIAGQTAIHILLMEAAGGMGKTILLNQFAEISKDLKCARVNFKDSSYTIGKTFSEIRDQFGRQRFEIFHTQCHHLLSQQGHDVTHNNIICEATDVTLTKLSGDELRTWQRLITKAFLADLEMICESGQAPLVLLFDEFQKVSASTKAWVTDLLIDEIRGCSWLVCVITGREIPRIPTTDTSWCLQHTLKPLSEQHSKEYIQKVKITQNEELVTFITKHSRGNPLMLQQLVQTLLETKL